MTLEDCFRPFERSDPSNITFDVYQHLTSGATFVLPSGAELKQAPNGDCTAALPSGKVQMRYPLPPYCHRRYTRLAFENSLVDGNTKGWVA